MDKADKMGIIPKGKFAALTVKLYEKIKGSPAQWKSHKKTGIYIISIWVKALKGRYYKASPLNDGVPFPYKGFNFPGGREGGIFFKNKPYPV